MSYDYQTERPRIFTEDGVETLTAIRNNVHRLIRKAGAVRFQEGVCEITGDSWLMLACFDYMVEQAEIHEVTDSNVLAQCRVFVAGPAWKDEV